MDPETKAERAQKTLAKTIKQKISAVYKKNLYMISKHFCSSSVC